MVEGIKAIKVFRPDNSLAGVNPCFLASISGRVFIPITTKASREGKRD